MSISLRRCCDLGLTPTNVSEAMKPDNYHWRVTIPLAQEAAVTIRKGFRRADTWFVIMTFGEPGHGALDIILNEDFTSRYPKCTFQTMRDFECHAHLNVSTTRVPIWAVCSTETTREILEMIRALDKDDHGLIQYPSICAVSTDTTITMIFGDWRVARSFSCTKRFRTEPIVVID